MVFFFAFVLGLLIGSFLNVCIHRWPQEESVVRPRSYCPRCGTSIAWYDNIPLFSYFFLGRKCRHCGSPISIRYPVVELLNAVLFVYVVSRFGVQPMTAKIAIFGSMMLILIFTDLAEYILPDEVTLGGLGLGVALSPFIHLEPGLLTQVIWWLADRQPPAWLGSLSESLLAAVVSGGLLYLIGEIYERVRHVEGLGFGDVKMIAMVGAFWGLGKAVLILILSSLIGAVSGLLIVWIARKRWDYALPFGSYLGITGILLTATVWGDDILRWYWGAALPPST